jgi:hypothetical protein
MNESGRKAGEENFHIRVTLFNFFLRRAEENKMFKGEVGNWKDAGRC